MTKEQAIKFIEENPQIWKLATMEMNHKTAIEFIKTIYNDNKKRTNKDYKSILFNIVFLLTNNLK